MASYSLLVPSKHNTRVRDFLSSGGACADAEEEGSVVIAEELG